MFFFFFLASLFFYYFFYFAFKHIMQNDCWPVSLLQKWSYRPKCNTAIVREWWFYNNCACRLFRSKVRLTCLLLGLLSSIGEFHNFINCGSTGSREAFAASVQSWDFNLYYLFHFLLWYLSTLSFIDTHANMTHFIIPCFKG